MLTMFITSITEQVAILIETARPVPGKKAIKKSLRARQQEQLCNSINAMIGHLKAYPAKLQSSENQIGDEIGKALIESFGRHCRKRHVSSRAYIL